MVYLEEALELEDTVVNALTSGSSQMLESSAQPHASAHVQHTSAYVALDSRCFRAVLSRVLLHTSAYVQHRSAYVALVSRCFRAVPSRVLLHTPAYVQHTSAYVAISRERLQPRPTAYVSIRRYQRRALQRQHT
jgi:hypothetical protein